MKHDKTFEAISKLRDIEIELHRLKNALEMANKALDAQRQWVGLTDEEMYLAIRPLYRTDALATSALSIAKDEYQAIETKLKEKNT